MGKFFLLENNKLRELEGNYTVEALQKMYEELENEANRKTNSLRVEWVSVMKDLAPEEREIQQKELEERRKEIEASKKVNEAELLEKYKASFAFLYKIKDEAEKYGDFESFYNEDGTVTLPRAQISFEEVVQQYPAGGVMNVADHYRMSANLNEGIEQIALRVKLDDESIPEFYISALPSDGNKARVSLSLAIDEEELKKFDFEKEEKIKENKEKIKKILKYLERHGLDPLDFEVPHEADGIEEFKPDRVKDEAQKFLYKKFAEAVQAVQNEIRAKNAQLEREEIKQNEIAALQRQKQYGENSESEEILDKLPNAKGILYSQAVDEDKNINKAVNKKSKEKMPSFDKVVDTMRELIEEDLAKKKRLSYWEKRSYLSFNKAKRNTVQFIIYPEENPNNRDEDGKRDDNGNKKLTYALKLFVQKMDDGRVSFYYKTPHNKPLDEKYVDLLTGKFQSLGYTHINFPNGLPDADKGLWRRMLAEKGIIPKGMGLNRSKAQGMIKAATEKLSAEKLSMFKYRLALQMQENYRKKGKKVDESERVYVEGLINSYHYEALTGGFAEYLKNSLKKQIAKGNEDRQQGAVTKVAAYMAMRRLFDIYKECVFADNILSSKNLFPEEVRMLQSAGLTGSIKEMKPHMMGVVYDILMERSKKQADEKIKFDIEHEPTPKRSPKLILNDAFNAAKGKCESINEELTAMGVDEIKFPAAFGPMYYTIEQPVSQAIQTNTQQPSIRSSMSPSRNNGNSSEM